MVNEDAQHALTFLRSHPVATLATVSDAGKPHAATIYIYTDDNLHMYFVTKTKTSKYINILNNENAAIVVTDSDTIETVQAEGRVKEINNAEREHELISALANIATNQSNWPPPVNKLKEGNFVVLEIEPTWMRWGKFEGPDEGETKAYFKQIIPLS